MQTRHSCSQPNLLSFQNRGNTGYINISTLIFFPQSIIIWPYDLALSSLSLRCFPIISKVMTKRICISRSGHISSRTGRMKCWKSVCLSMATFEICWAFNIHLHILLIECCMNTDPNMRYSKGLVFQDRTIMLLLPFFQQEHCQLVFKHSVLQSFLTALSRHLLWTSYEEWVIIGSTLVSFACFKGFKG